MQIKSLKERSPFVLFLPFLFLYTLFVICFHTDEMQGDELRYIEFAQNLLHGFYSPAYPDINLINGPGYPLVLLPFTAFKLPLISITLFNAVLHYISVVYVFKSVQLITHAFRISCITALCWGCYFLAYQEMPCILTETLTLFLVSAFSYQIIRVYSGTVISYRSLILPGLTFGFLILTKVIFAYVLLVLILVTGIGYIIYKQKIRCIPFACILGIAFLSIVPYITYTYALTGKFFYLSSEGGKVLYWMTSLDAHEYGDWNNNTFTANCGDPALFCNKDYIEKNHAADMERIRNSSSMLEADSLFKVMAFQNIRTSPSKYIKNWFANIGRLLFGFPSSYYFQSPTTLVRIYVNSILLLAMLYALVVCLWKWKAVPLEIRILILFSMSYLGLSTLVSAYPRQFNVVVPAILIWVVYAVKNSVRINLTFSKDAR